MEVVFAIVLLRIERRLPLVFASGEVVVVILAFGTLCRETEPIVDDMPIVGFASALIERIVAFGAQLVLTAVDRIFVEIARTQRYLTVD